jgi:hypothetical protein
VGSSTVWVGPWLRRPLVLLLSATVHLNTGPEAFAAVQQPIAQAIPLECRLGQGPWQACRMEVVAIGSQWALVVGDQRWHFRHDGLGSVTMQHGAAAWRPVRSRWEGQNSLCWDGVCARGDIPLD